MNLTQASGEGHTFLPQEELTAKTSELLGIDKEIIEKNYMDLSIDRKIIMKQSGEQTQIYSASFYYMEANTATMLRELMRARYSCLGGMALAKAVRPFS